jgi:hypothetical protein
LRAQTPAGSKVCRIATTASISTAGAPSFSATVCHVHGQITGFIDGIDQVLPDDTPHRIADRERKLLREVFRQRALRRHEGFEIVFRHRPSPPDPTLRPFRIGRAGIVASARWTRIDRNPPGTRCRAGPELFLHRAATDFEIVPHPFGPGLAIRRFALRRGRFGAPSAASATGVSPSLARSSRGFFFELVVDISGQIQVRELQQLDRLHQLRRHHQRLGLAEFQSGGQCHESLLAPRHDLCM